MVLCFITVTGRRNGVDAERSGNATTVVKIGECKLTGLKRECPVGNCV